MHEATLEAVGPITTNTEETNSAEDQATRYQYPCEGRSSPSLNGALAGRTVSAPAMSPVIPSSTKILAGGFVGVKSAKETAANRAAAAATSSEKGFAGVLRSVFLAP